MPKLAGDDGTHREERLSRLGRDWFAEVRRRHPDEPVARRKSSDGDAGGADVEAGGLDRLFGGDGEGEASGGDAGD